MTVVDARGHHCPVPSLKLRRAVAEVCPGTIVELLATDPMAQIDIPHLVREIGGELLGTEETDGVFTFRVETPAARRD